MRVRRAGPQVQNASSSRCSQSCTWLLDFSVVLQVGGFYVIRILDTEKAKKSKSNARRRRRRRRRKEDVSLVEFT